VAELPVSEGGRTVAQYQRIIIPAVRFAAKGHARWYSWVKGRARVLLGARPVALTLELKNAWTCKSFHLTVAAPDGLYLGEQKALGLNALMNRRADGAPVLPYYRFRARLGQPHAHFYSRFLPAPEEGQQPPKLKFRFFEVPPGSVFRAAVAAMSCFVLVSMVAWMMSHTSDPGTDAPAFLLAFPAVAATWLGFESPTRRLFEGTFTARCSLLITAATAIASSGLFMLYRSEFHSLHGGFPHELAIFGIHEYSWAILVVVAFCNAASLVYITLMRTWAYTYLCSVNRPVVWCSPRVGDTASDGSAQDG
jgi:hypothetical protein